MMVHDNSIIAVILVLCGVDHFSENGMKPCNKCNASEEQPLIGKSSCIGCSMNSTSPLCQSGIAGEPCKKSIIMISLLNFYSFDV